MSSLTQEIYQAGQAVGFIKSIFRDDPASFAECAAKYLYPLVQGGIFSASWAAEKLGISEEQFVDGMLAAEQHSDH